MFLTLFYCDGISRCYSPESPDTPGKCLDCPAYEGGIKIDRN
jgi:hypothetical protein